MATTQMRRHNARSDASPGTPLTDSELRFFYHTELALSGAAASIEGLSGILGAVESYSTRPQWLFHPSGHLMSCTSTATRFKTPPLKKLLDHAMPAEDVDIVTLYTPPVPHRGISRGHLLSPVTRNDDHHGWWVVAETPNRFTRLDRRFAERVAHHLASKFELQQRVAQANWNAQSMFTRQLVRGSGREDDLLASAEYLGINANARRIVIYAVTEATTNSNDEIAASTQLSSDLDTEILSTRGNEGIIFLVEVPPERADGFFLREVKEAMQRFIDTSGSVFYHVGISSATARPGLRKAYRQSREVAQCIERFTNGHSRVLTVDDLGPARLLVANSEAPAIYSYVKDTLGPLHEDPSNNALVETLKSYFAHHRSVKLAASTLGVHENTIRLRLDKINSLLDVDILGDSQDQLTLQTALLILRLVEDPRDPSKS